MLMLFTTAAVPEMTVNAGNSYAASGSAAATADERKNETSLTNELYARAAVLMDAENGRILFSKNGDEVLPMASTTKIMTCVLALETGNPEDVLPVSSYAARQPKVHMGVQKGEYYRMEDLLYGLMLESYNDAAVVIAEYYGSKAAGLSMDCSLHTEEESRKAVLTFARKMNEKAKEMGLEDTHFTNCTGLHNDNHYSTCRDLASIMCYAVNNTFCYTLMTTKEYKAPAYSTEKNKNFFYYPSHTLLVDRAKLVLKSQPSNLTVTGGKTGFTDESRHCLATCGVAADGTRYVSVTAQAQTQVDTITDYITIYETYAK